MSNVVPNVVLDFCSNCTALLPEGQKDAQNPRCPNCNAPVFGRNFRCEGTFDLLDSHYMRNPRNIEWDETGNVKIPDKRA